MKREFGIAGFIISIISIIFAIFIPILGLILGIVGLILCIIQLKKEKNGLAIAGLIINILAIAIVIINLISSLVIWKWSNDFMNWNPPK
jgi:uncharacterized membrane protein